MRPEAKLLRLALVTLAVACAFALPPPRLSAARQDGGRSLGVITIKAEDGKEVRLYEKSYALVVGVSDYTQGWPKLPGVRRDVEEVARALERHGFLVTKVENPDSAQLEKSFRQFIDAYGLGVENRLLFYFAGHGHTVRQSYGEEMGYIVPADAPLPDRDRAGFMSKAMDMQQMELYARRIQSKHALFLFDSCFSGALFALSRAVPDAINYKTARPVRQFITSGSADEQVPDQSVFRRQFVEALNGEADTNRDGYVTGTELGEFLQDKVINYSRNTQHPQYGKIRNPNLDKGDFVFALPKAPKPTPVADASPAPAPTRPAPVDPAALELAFWDAIKNSTDPEDFKEYLGKYPSGQFAGVAQRRISALSASKPAAPLTGENSGGNTSAAMNTGAGAPSPAASSAVRPPVPASMLRSFDYVTVTLDAAGKLKSREPKRATYYAEDLGGVALEMAEVPGGTFMMGSPTSEANRNDNEGPQHRVSVPGFWMGKYEVTQAQYEAIMGTNPSNFKGGDLPVEQVSWNEALEFCKRLSAKTGREYRLPSEAEWEYAARAGTTTPFAFGETITPEIVTYVGKKTTPVGSMGAANGFGLYDMHGNVWEWVQDYYHENYGGLVSDAPTDGSAWMSGGDSNLRVLRGGGWWVYDHICRSASRKVTRPDCRSASCGWSAPASPVGFRVVSSARS